MSKNGNHLPPLRVLLVDDSSDDELLIVRELKRSYKVSCKRVETEAALQLELEERSWDVVICDYLMPHLSAARALAIFKASIQDIPFIVLSGAVNEDVVIDILRAGAHDFVSKDNLPRLTLAVKRELRESARRFQHRLDLENSFEKTIEAWGRALEMRDHYTQGHTLRVTDLTIRLARKIGLEHLSNIHRGALLHDVGKMGVPDMILFKEGELTLEERRIMNQHPTRAYNMLKDIDFLKESLAIPYCHHEKWDGSGYPRQLAGEQIPFEARVFSVVDVFDALTNDRPYRKALSRAQALALIEEGRGKAFDPFVVDKFFEMMEETGDTGHG